MWSIIVGQIGPIQLLNDDGGVTVWTVGLIFIVCFIVYLIYESFLRKKGVNSPEKQRIVEIINEVTGGDTSLTTAYAHWSTYEGQANRSITRYWFYAIGFNKERIVVVPLSFLSTKPRQITYKNSFIIQPEMLALVNGKHDGKQTPWVELYDKEGNKLVSLSVKDYYTDTSVSHEKVNIVQKEAAEKWRTEFVPYWMDRVNAVNSTQATGYRNNATKWDFKGRGDNVEGGGKAKNM